MRRYVVLALLLATSHLSPAESFRLQGSAFRPGDTPVDWEAKVGREWLWVYTVIPQSFSPSVISNAMTICRFKPRDVVDGSAKGQLRFQDHKQKERVNRCLEISVPAGWMEYWDNAATSGADGPAEGVPDFKEVERLGLDILFKLGIDRTQISSAPRYKSDVKHSQMSPAGEPSTEVQVRGMKFTRQIDGMYFLGLGSLGGLDVEFGDHAKVVGLVLVWKNLVPHELRRVATPSDMRKYVERGEGVYPAQDVRLQGANRFTVKSLIPCYWADRHGSLRDYEFAYPVASLGVEAQFATNKLDFTVVCPILAPDQAALKK